MCAPFTHSHELSEMFSLAVSAAHTISAAPPEAQAATVAAAATVALVSLDKFQAPRRVKPGRHAGQGWP